MFIASCSLVELVGTQLRRQPPGEPKARGLHKLFARGDCDGRPKCAVVFNMSKSGEGSEGKPLSVSGQAPSCCSAKLVHVLQMHAGAQVTSPPD